MERILIIEDEEFYGEFLRKIVRKHYACDWAKNGDDAKLLFAKHAYDVVLYDLRVPGSSGRELIRYVKECVDPDTVNIVITGFENDWPAVEATGEHIFFYMRKGSFKPEDLLKVLDNAVELRRLRRREAELLKSAIAAEKLASAGKLAVSIAHEINNPLQGIVSMLDVLRSKGERPESDIEPGSLARDLDILEKSVDRIRNVVRQLTGLHGADSPSGAVGADAAAEDFPLNTVTERVVSFIRPIAREKNTKITYRGNHRIDMVKVSERQFFQVLLNTCMNLLDGNHESIDIRTSGAKNRAVLTITAVRRDPAGRPAEGLEITKNIVRSLSGRIEVKEDKAGETITITFPDRGAC